MAIIVYKAILDSDISFLNFNYRIGALYIAMHLTPDEVRRSPLARILPSRTARGGMRPGVNANPKSEENWEFPEDEITEFEERLIVAMASQIGILAMMNTHHYSFNGKTYLQQAGGPIGLRATCAVARVVMNTWDVRWLEMMSENGLDVMTGIRYMDDIRAFLKAIREGWRWWEDRLCFCEEWRIEDLKDGKSATRRTAEILLQIMNSIMPFLRFTLEIGEEFSDQKLPTLDVKIWVKGGKLILHDFFEKPMSTNLVLHVKTAQSQNTKLSSLTQEVVRRLLHTSKHLPKSNRLENLDRLSVKMMTSGHKQEFARKVMITGIVKFERKVKRSALPSNHKEYKPLHLGTHWNSLGRWKSKVLGVDTWFEDKKMEKVDVTAIPLGRKKPYPKTGKDVKDMKTSTVMFIPSSRGGILTSMLREKEDEMVRITRFRVKFQEAGGVKLARMFSTSIW